MQDAVCAKTIYNYIDRGEIPSVNNEMLLEKHKRVFKSITSGSGSEFLDYKALERSIFGGRRTHIYYAHPYSSWDEVVTSEQIGLSDELYPKVYASLRLPH